MKNAITAAILLTAVVVFLSINSSYIGTKSDEMLLFVEEMEKSVPGDERTETVTRCLSVWKSCRKRLAMCVPGDDLFFIDNQFALLTAYMSEEENGDFDAAVATLKNALHDLRNEESLSIDNIF